MLFRTPNDTRVGSRRVIRKPVDVSPGLTDVQHPFGRRGTIDTSQKNH